MGWMIGFALAVPIIPFVVAGPWIEESLAASLAAIAGRPLLTSIAVVAVLAVDILLPVPSSAVATLAGQTLGPALAVLCVWSGMMLSSAFGFETARRFGRSIAERFSQPAELAAGGERLRDWGTAGLVVTRPIPILAEACVLWVGLQGTGPEGFPRRRFYAVMAWANAAVAAVFVLLGWISSEGEFPAIGLLLSVLLPLLLMFLLGGKHLRDRL